MAAIVVVLVLLPMIYLLSIGPIVWLHRRGHLNVGPDSVIAWVYAPAERAARACPPFERVMEGYISLWEPPNTAAPIAPQYLAAPASPAASATYSAPTAPAEPESATSER